jgi:hypothetical protein
MRGQTNPKGSGRRQELMIWMGMITCRSRIVKVILVVGLR